MAPYGSRWAEMVPDDSIWSHMVPYGPRRAQTAPDGSIWFHMVLYVSPDVGDFILARKHTNIKIPRSQFFFTSTSDFSRFSLIYLEVTIIWPTFFETLFKNTFLQKGRSMER